ncbi:MAG: DUF2314 domain-containing protein [Cyanobacteria bacterium J06621_11]
MRYPSQDSSDHPTSITFRKAADPKLLQATQNAKATFKYFWKEVALDFSRVVPALSLAAVKVAFSDDFANPDAPVEHMWVEQIDFDGTTMTGVLLNSPNALTSISEGDKVAFPIDRLGDWIGVMAGKVYGGHTVQVIRSGMDADERSRYDASWGLDFPPPETVFTFEGVSPFETVIANEMKKQIPKNRSLLTEKFDGGRSLLHLEALYGRQESLEVLLSLGADRNLLCDRNWTPLGYAKALGWADIIQRLERPV